MRNTEWLFDSNSTGSTTFRLITTDGVLIPVTRNSDSSPTYFSFRGGRILGVLVEKRCHVDYVPHDYLADEPDNRNL